MPLNKLDNLIKNTEGRILYVSPSDLDATDSISNQGNSLARPFKTVQRALIESARFSYVRGSSNDEVEKTTILLMPGEHTIDNRPGWSFASNGEVRTSEFELSNTGALSLTLDSNFDINQKDNDLYKFNSVNGGVIVPRGTSIVGLDLRKTKIRPLYIPNPTYSFEEIPSSAIFRITGACYLWQFSIFDGDEFGTVYTQPSNFDSKATPTFSHHKLTVFEYADGVNNAIVNGNDKGLTDLQMYYAKLSYAYGSGSGRTVDSDDVYGSNDTGFSPQRPEFEIVGAFAADPLTISSIRLGDGATSPSRVVTVTTASNHELSAGTPIRISGISGPSNFIYNISTKVVEVDENNPRIFTYIIEASNAEIALATSLITGQGEVTVETDTVTGASPYIFNISMRSVWGMNGMHADGSKATGFRSMVVAQFTGVSLQKDDRAFVKYNPANNRQYEGLTISNQSGATLSSKSSSSGTVYHLDSDAIYRKGWEQTHIKITNDAIVQIVSVFAIGYNKHFEAQSGGDASVTNSNSNFGQLSLISQGFKKEAFEKDNKAFITHIIPPRAIVGEEEDIDWLTIDFDNTKSVANNERLYLNGFEDENVNPPILTQGYRIGAKVGDKIYLRIGESDYSANILMANDANSSSFKDYKVGAPTANIFSGTGNHGFLTGEKVIIISDDGDLPENLKTNTVYYIIKDDNTRFKLAASEAEAISGQEITVYGGTNLTVTSRVSDKESGDIAHPVQWDGSNSQWYINVGDNNIYNEIISQDLSGVSEPSFVKRISDSRSLDEKIYKARIVVPKQLQNAKTPEAGFIVQESSSTGYRNNDDSTLSGITTSEYDYNRNPRFISTCSFSAPTVTVISELPHNLQNGDSVIIKNVTDDSISGDAYNGTYNVTVVDDMTFTYTTSLTPGTFTNNTTSRTISLPRFERNDIQSNIYIYRNEIISQYSENDQDGIYHVYLLNSDNAIENEFTNLKYSQNVTDLYPQLDRDNVNDSPNSANSYALRSPIGDVTTNDLKKSITRETADKLLTTLGIGLKISDVTNPTSNSPTITFDRRHGLNGIVEASITNNSIVGTILVDDSTNYNIKLYDGSTWKGATANITVSSGTIDSITIVSSGSGHNVGDTLNIGLGSAEFEVTSVSSDIGNVIQFTGVGTSSDSYHRIINAVGAGNTISIARTSGDPVITSDYYAFITSPSIVISGASGDTITANSHGLAVGNKIRIIDSSNNNVGDYIVNNETLNTIEVSGFNAATTSGFILKHGLSSNSGSSDKSNENLQARAFTIFDGETMTLSETGGINNNTSTFSVSGAGIGTMSRFPLGSYIQIDNEIMRIASDTLISPTDKITVIRGALATKPESHSENSLIKKIKVPSIELRRPSIIRASGHTFEYLGYGPGNYSTALPQVQNKTLTEKEEFLVQAQERSSGIVVYTGMNNKGDFFIGNQKKSSATGEEITFDTPIPTVTGEDPSRLSAVFDEVTIKERLVVEGGDSKQILSQLDGPVTFNNEVRFTNENGIQQNPAIKISFDKNSTSTSTGALVVDGGVGISKDVNIGGSMFFPDNKSLYFGNNNDLEIYHNGTNSFIDNDTGHLYIRNNVNDDDNSNIYIQAKSGEDGIIINDDGSVELYYDNAKKLETTSTGVNVTGIVTATTGFVPDTDNGAYLGTSALSFSELYLDNIKVDDNTISITNTNGNLNLNPNGTGRVKVSTTLSVSNQTTRYLSDPSGNYGSIQINGSGSGNYEGFSIDGRAVFMHDGSNTTGIFDDVNDEWLFKATHNGSAELYYNGSSKIQTSNTGVNVTGIVSATEVNVTGTVSATTLSGSLANTLTLATNGNGIEGSATYNNSGAVTFTVTSDATSANTANTIVHRNSNGNFSAGTITATLSGTATNATNVDIEGASNTGTYRIALCGGTTGNNRIKSDGGLTYDANGNNLYVSGDITAFYSSDERLKENVTLINDPLAKVLSLSGYTFDWNDNSHKEGSETGVIAQEVESLGLPGIVTTRDNGYKAVRYEKLVPLLIEAIKELSEKVDSLEQKLQDK